jgi:hypothetical protein
MNALDGLSLVAVALLVACGSGGSARDGGARDAAVRGGDAAINTSCDKDVLHTGLTTTQTGVSVDAYDCDILAATVANSEPDPMIFKAIIYVESRFDPNAIACSNMPCGTPSGWSASETGCYGLMQIVPACGGSINAPTLLPNGQPDLTMDSSSSEWSGSVFNPQVNVSTGVAGIASNRAQVEQQFPGCTVDQYTLMAIGNYNDYGSTKSCTEYNQSYDMGVLTAYQQYATAAGYPAHAY